MRAPISSTLRWLILLGVLLSSLVVSRSLGGQEKAPSGSAYSAVAGALSYRVYCASCHGPKAKGDGPVAEVLRIPPPDLTSLAARHGGVFPAEKVRRSIDGRDEIRSHGRSEMPVWGLAFRESGRSTEEEAEIQQRILDLVEYLRTIQVGDERT